MSAIEARTSATPFVPNIQETLLSSTYEKVDNIGWTNGRRVTREVLGRRYVGSFPVADTEQVVFELFARPQGGPKDAALFTVAKPHQGYTGLEAVVTRVVSRKNAEKLVFTSTL